LLAELIAFFRGFAHAIRGLRILVVTQRNAWFHLLATIVVVASGIMTRRTISEWAMLIAAIGFVWFAEALNTALEQLSNRVTRERDPLIRDVKDLASGAVLVAAFTSIALGVTAFWRGPWLF
jgi:diacylglycerol kinase (ATP)